MRYVKTALVNAIRGLMLGCLAVACEGPPGPPGPPAPAPDAAPTAPDATPERFDVDVAPPTAMPRIEVDGLVGVVRNPSGQALDRGTIALVPAEVVAALAATPIDLSAPPEVLAAITHDEPIEDALLREAVLRAPIAEDGSYRFATIPPGRFFVVFEPARGDDAYLPGGDRCRVALGDGSLRGARLDVRVSGRPAPDATYVGSSSCMVCHGRHSYAKTAHRNALRVPGRRGALQDTSRFPRIDDALFAFERGTVLHYSRCEGECLVTERDPRLDDPSIEVALTVTLERDGDDYVAELAAGGRSERLPVVLVSGGALARTQLVVRGRGEHFVLPVSYQLDGGIDAEDPRDARWRAFRTDDWLASDGSLRRPRSEASFDASCAGCHFTGFALGGDDALGFAAHAASDVGGELDYDGDGRLDEIDIGCESCHGPGSSHLEARGERIVSPSLLTPERETLLCGRCHSRPEGAHGSEAPISNGGAMPWAGLRRAELGGYVQRVDDADLHASGDSRAHHQEYSDFIRTTMYRNDAILMTCSSCHDAHGGDEAHDLIDSPRESANCTTCHSSEPYVETRLHVTSATGNLHAGLEPQQLECVRCHMARTATLGARRLGLLDDLPRTSPALQYFAGDIASHRFEVTSRTASASQPVAFTDRCGVCHATVLP